MIASVAKLRLLNAGWKSWDVYRDHWRADCVMVDRFGDWVIIIYDEFDRPSDYDWELRRFTDPDVDGVATPLYALEAEGETWDELLDACEKSGRPIRGESRTGDWFEIPTHALDRTYWWEYDAAAALGLMLIAIDCYYEGENL